MIRNLFFVLFLLRTSFFFSQNPGKANWMAVNGPNYTVNQHLAYPYSNKDIATGNNVKLLPLKSSAFVHLIDFYGEGRIEENGVVLGFKSAYNINLQYQLVSKGVDKGRRIPNRIPVASYDGELGLSRYVANDRVTTITLTGAHLQQNTIQEMTRMVRKDGLGKIIIYGYRSTDPGVVLLEKELAKIGFHYAPSHVLRPPFNEIKGLPYTPRVYKSSHIEITGEKTFYSLNPKTDFGISMADMVTLNYSRIMQLNADLKGGIKGTINKSGGKIEVEVFSYDNNQNNGIEQIYANDLPVKNKTVYKVYSDISSTDNYIEKTTKIPYGFARDVDGSYRTLGETDSNNIKLLGADSKSGWKSGDCSDFIVKGITWFKWKFQSLFYSDIPFECQDVITKIRTGRHPILIKVTIKDATLYDFKIPGVIDYSLMNLVPSENETLQRYKVIKKVKVTILEAPNDFIETNVYKTRIASYIKEANSYYTAKTGNIPNPEVTAEIGNPRILFKNVELIIKKGSRQIYNFQLDSHAHALESESELEENDDKTIQLIYVHTIISSSPSKQQKAAIRGYTDNSGDTIKNDNFCIFSYSSIFNDDPKLAGTPGSTLAHELGHYFGLLHPFSGGCAQTNGGDKVSDTPPAEGEHWYVVNPLTSNAHLLENPCENAPRSCNGIRRQIENIMDYGPCRWLFTKGQTEQIINRINTKPSLFTTYLAYDMSIDPNAVNIIVDDQRHGELRKKRSLTDRNDFYIEMSSSNSNSEYRNVTIFSDHPGNVTIRIHNLNSMLIYENNVTVKKGQNSFNIASGLFKPSILYIISCTNEYTTEHIKFISRN